MNVPERCTALSQACFISVELGTGEQVHGAIQVTIIFLALSN